MIVYASSARDSTDSPAWELQSYSELFYAAFIVVVVVVLKIMFVF